MASKPPFCLAHPQDIPADLALGEPLLSRDYLLDGELRTWTGAMQEVHAPVFVEGSKDPERQLLGSCPAHAPSTGQEALTAACTAWDQGLGDWPNLPPEARMACVEDFCLRMNAKRTEIVRLMIWEICKSRKESEQEFDRTIEYIEDTLCELRRMLSEDSHTVKASRIDAQIGHSPLGVVLCMGPFNFPLNETLATLIPALLMGNTAVVKLPRIGRMLFFPLMDCFHKAFPRGVVNILSGGIETVTPAMTSGKVDVLAFIGTSRAAQAMHALHPHPNRLRCVLGLEAKNAAIILPDADLVEVVAEILRGAFGFNGQRCTAIKLIFVARSIADAFLERFCAAVAGLKIGLPWEQGVNITPLPEPGKVQFLDALRADALAKGARELTPNGGPMSARPDETFFAPSVLYPVTPHMRLFREEQFGPIAPVAVFDEPTEVLRAIAASDYGQQASVFGSDPVQLADLSQRLRNLVSRVNINCKCQRGPDELPFTARRDSAVGTLSVRDGLLAFSLPTLAVVRDKPTSKPVLQALDDLRAMP
ncbi:MAG: aldehyde dehydrogenase family protein [Humidesulfovibrio sp.]|uniref:aldehyde dehydrogenase family protein n=1 Tax=Humidesulfovibrio sp. TaxID=2910988 RepID=UPI0027358571|nr:aldehyde dehydrogenase family protein [Humidesulfovibrio sp.]MDP2847908.1 aldehyde dehydrogenase family protein [Humidesulfovibrio sp.]